MVYELLDKHLRLNEKIAEKEITSPNRPEIEKMRDKCALIESMDAIILALIRPFCARLNHDKY